MSTSEHPHSRHHLELWSDAKNIDFFIDMFSVAGETWVLAAMTGPGEEQITTVTVAGEYLSTHVPEEGPVGGGGVLHALTRGRRGRPVQCFGCQEMGHIIMVSNPQAETWEHTVRTGQDNVEEMARAMEAACCCEIVVDTTQALDADWGKLHNPWEHACPLQVKRWGEGP